VKGGGHREMITPIDIRNIDRLQKSLYDRFWLLGISQ
jgi:hypothetical protein